MQFQLLSYSLNHSTKEAAVMFIFFTPYTYFFMSLYFLTLSFLLSINRFLFYWLFIEVLMLLFIGISYTVFLHRYSQLIVYFLFQTLASFSILAFYLLSLKYLLLLSLFLKLGMFPFFSWYINVLYRFPSSILFLASTFHKLPPLLILYIVCELNYIPFIVVISLVTIFVSSVYMLYITDLRYLLVVSRIGNNAFIVLATLTNNISLFTLFYRLYTVNLFLIFYRFGPIVSHNLQYHRALTSLNIFLFFLLLNLSSLPPLPTFLSKFLVIFYCMESYSSISYLFVLILLTNVVIVVSYISILLKYFINIYSNSTRLLVY